ncbi:phage gp6-like head-tail connector protein [Kitasatospora purpeofusca]|uniref:phage gp6-like head-tail connector protein n=1 Tax=Kitasatospora purpeofusca TaxID=67352 RepID=UPI00225B6BA3|nr:phage gp6-like head-tail connector protein [Kitasatospora purpeofusca]MCX4752895.1 phage gp6-like head-tail connector protein [Kitasatospora purpeofusca]WSR32439.1 phage gp6-like head-tail connector protein [Kitasatospora purpeofusca]WSR40526.1 phage gp6-like head-tail connector protein [Kitasatospora purpeofusca]
MANEYADLATVKAALNLADGDPTSDAMLTQALGAASRGIDRLTGRRFWLDAAPVQRVYRLTGRVAADDDGDRLVVDDIGSLDGLVVETGGATTWSPVTGYLTAPDNAHLDGEPITSLVLPHGRWGTRDSRTRVRVTARFGWPAVPDEVAQATQIQALRLYRRKDSPDGVTGSAEWGVVRLSRVDPDVAALVERLQLPGMG